MSDVTTPETEKSAATSSPTTRRSPSGRRRRWRPKALPALHRAPVAGTPLGLYLHIPFCRKRCHFCYFRVYTDKNAEEVDDLPRCCSPASGSSTRRCRRSPAGRSTSSTSAAARRPSSRPRSSAAWSTRLKAATPWDRAEEVTFECEPGTLTEAKLVGDPRHRRHAPQPRRRALRRSHPRAERPRPPLGGDRPRLRLRPRPRLPADQHRPDRRHARRDRRQLAAAHRPRRSSSSRTASPSTRWSCPSTPRSAATS